MFEPAALGDIPQGMMQIETSSEVTSGDFHIWRLGE